MRNIRSKVWKQLTWLEEEASDTFPDMLVEFVNKGPKDVLKQFSDWLEEQINIYKEEE